MVCGMITAGAEANDDIRTQVVRNYRQFVADVDPKGGIMDHLIEAGVVSIETKERIVSHVTRQVGLATARNRPIGPYVLYKFDAFTSLTVLELA